jgi:hypothetical protein
MKFLRYPVKSIMEWKLLGALTVVFLAHTVQATIPLYQNFDVLQYEVPGNPPPTIDAKAFDNENTLTIGFAAYTPYVELYEPWNTVNYTNLGTMIGNSPYTTNGAVIYLGLGSFGSGFQFDLQTTNQIPHRMAGTFYNPGNIRCDSVQDGNNIFNFGAAGILYLVTSLGQCVVSATNLINPGTLDVGYGGLIQLQGQKVDLTGGELSVEGALNSLGNPATVGTLGTVNFSSVGAVGLNTNVFWDPAVELTPVAAQSAFVPIAPFYLNLTNSQAYFNLQQPATNYNLYRCVFVQNNSPNVPYNVYFDNPNTQNLGFQPGAAHVEWVGSYTDPASGNPINDYLYLTDDYLLGASTNVVVIGGVPDNFTFITSPTGLLAGPTGPGFPVNFPGFPDVELTNVYAFMNGTLTASMSVTNASIVNPSGNVTNLPGAIKIAASNELNLAFAQISGPNYLLLNCTNQVDGSPLSISAPYSDIYLGVTNGFMVASNLLTANIPNWSGNIQAWSTVWSTVDALGNTNEYRVMLVYSSLQPTTSPWTQNLYLHGTNSLVISDALTAYGSFYSDARNLTLNTNYVGNGATSLYGQLNWYNSAPFNANTASGTQQMPNLLWLTNNGTISALNTANFGGGSTVFGAFINNSLVADQGTTIWATNFLNDGTISNGTGSFTLQARLAFMTNGNIVAGGDISLGAANSLVISNHLMQAGHKLTLWTTNLTDGGTTNGNIWVVGTAGIGGTFDSGFNIPVKPATGDLLGTTVTNIAPISKAIYNVWSGTNAGLSTQGYNNNLAVGQLILDLNEPAGLQNPNSFFYFNGVGTNNAIYVDRLVLMDAATNSYNTNSYNFQWLKIATNMTIYYAQAIMNGVSVAEKIDVNSQHGANGGRLRWISSYAGYFSSTNLVYPDGTTNAVNAALAQSSDIDSDGDGVYNNNDPTPVFVPSQVNFTAIKTNVPAPSVKVQWATVPNATNFIYFRTNLLAGSWLALTNFKNYYYANNVSLTNAAHANSFISPQPYPSPATNVWVFDAVTNVPHFYRVVVYPWLNYPQ